MTLILSVMAGAIGANMAAATWPRQAMMGLLNLILGMIGGVATWAAAYELSLLSPEVSVLLGVMFYGAFGGAVVTLGAGSLRNIIQGDRSES